MTKNRHGACRTAATRLALMVMLAASLSTTATRAQDAPGATAPPPHRPKVCLVLAGGGARGIAHVGVLNVLAQMHVPIDCVVGTSMGSIVGAAFASGIDAGRIQTIVTEANWDRLLSDSPDRAEHSVYAKALERHHVGTAEIGLRGSDVKLPTGVLVGQQLQPFLRGLVRPGTDLNFDELPIPYRAVATDFETGQIVVLDHGDLSIAVRASMSVPGAFAPVDYEGRLLVDGGLVRNLPIDIARRFHPDVIIAVDLGAPLLKRSEIGSVFTVGLQTINILMAQNVERSLGDLSAQDVLIQPDVSDVDSSDFQHSLRAIPRGEAAARAVADRLAQLSVSPEEYAAWERIHDRPTETPKYAHVILDTSALQVVNPVSIEAMFRNEHADATLQQRIDNLMGTDSFERVDAHTESGPDGTSLVLRPVEKSWGPDYLRLGISLGADFGGGSDFTIFVDQRRTWLTQSGLEWRSHASIGRTNSLWSELRQPLDAAHNWFVDGSLGVENEQRNLYVDEFPVSTYRQSEFTGASEIGRQFGNLGEAAVGIRAASAIATFYSGVPLSILNGHRQVNTDLTARFSSDTLDNLDFPQHGHVLLIDGDFARQAFGSHLSYDRISIGGSEAFGAGPTSVFVTGRLQTSAGSTLPIYRQFGLGGFLEMSGLRVDQLLAERIVFLRTVVRQRVASAGTLLPGLYVGASLEGADVRDRINALAPDIADAVTPSNARIGAGSVFLSAQSLLGPFYLGLGHSRGGQTSLYLYVGRP